MFGMTLWIFIACQIRRSLLRQSREVASQRMRLARSTDVPGGGEKKNRILHRPKRRSRSSYTESEHQITASTNGFAGMAYFVEEKSWQD